MKKINVVKEKRDFNNIINNSKYFKNHNLIIYYEKNNCNRYRFGISVGKKIGNAVVRNRYKRIIRNIVDLNKNNYQNNLDYIIIVRKSCLNMTFEEINNSFLDLIVKINRSLEEMQNEKK